MRALCVCNGGNVRSVTLARLLKKRGIEAIPIGVGSLFSDKTLLMLFDWVKDEHDGMVYIQKDAEAKLNARMPGWRSLAGEHRISTVFDVGPDDWKVPMHPDLLAKMRKMVEEYLDKAA